MKRIAALLVFFLFFVPALCVAHFGMVIPDHDTLSQETGPGVKVTLSFSHPFDGVGMPLVKPSAFDLYTPFGKKNLRKALLPSRVMGEKGWRVPYAFKRPGVYQFVMTPEPYWEPAEDVFIIHTTKTIVPAFGGEEGWDRELGLATEIVPMTRPFGLYAGNLFQGVVKVAGKPVAGAEVEVEFFNEKREAKAPSGYHVTQVVKADENGVFSFVAPKKGWWGFAALTEAPYTLEVKGEKKGVELGAVLWVHFSKWAD